MRLRTNTQLGPLKTGLLLQCGLKDILKQYRTGRVVFLGSDFQMLDRGLLDG